MRKHVVMVLFICCVVASSVVLAGDVGRLTKDTYFEMENLRSPTISPNGHFIVFTREWVDKKEDRFRRNLWIIDRNGQRLRELTHGNWRDSSPVWSPDGSRIAFLSDRDGTDQIHVMWPDTGEVAQLTHMERAPSNLKWSPDGKLLAFNMFEPDDDPILKVELPKKPKGAKWAKPAVIVDRLTWARDGRGPIDKGYTHVFVIDSVMGGTPRQITKGDYNHNEPEWSTDGKTVFVSAIRKPDAEYLRGNTEIFAVNLDTLEVEALTDRNGPDRGPKISPDGQWLAYRGYDDKNYTSHLSSLYLMDMNGHKSRLWAGDLPSSPRSVTWAKDSSGVYFTIGEKGVNTVYFAPVEGDLRRVVEGNHTLSGLTVADNGYAAALKSTFKRPGYLVAFDIEKGSEMTELVDVNTDVLGNIQLGEAEEIWYKSKDGLDVQGWIIKPPDFDPKKKYPMLLWIHGGPWSMYTVRFNWAWQNFAANGYVVLYTNPRGSTGYGQDFVNGIQYSYPGEDRDDLLAGVDAAIAKGFIDENNLFVCGGSGGGVLTAWLVGHTDRFTAAVSMRPVINWHSFVGTTDGPNWYRQFKKYPWEDPMEYAVRSPLHMVANVTTPTMVMTGEADLRTPMSQSEEYYRALKMLKKDTLLVRMPNEYHGWRRPSHRLLQQLYLMAWFEKYMQPSGSKATEDNSQ